jgi:hypothetical protein
MFSWTSSVESIVNANCPSMNTQDIHWDNINKEDRRCFAIVIDKSNHCTDLKHYPSLSGNRLSVCQFLPMRIMFFVNYHSSNGSISADLFLRIKNSNWNNRSRLMIMVFIYITLFSFDKTSYLKALHNVFHENRICFL